MSIWQKGLLNLLNNTYKKIKFFVVGAEPIKKTNIYQTKISNLIIYNFDLLLVYLFRLIYAYKYIKIALFSEPNN